MLTLCLLVSFHPRLATQLSSKRPTQGEDFFGVFKYELLDRSTQKSTEHMAVLFRVPHNVRLKRNEYTVGVFDISRECNGGLYSEMSKKADPAFIKGPLSDYTGRSVTIKATMSDCSSPVIKVEVGNRDI